MKPRPFSFDPQRRRALTGASLGVAALVACTHATSDAAESSAATAASPSRTGTTPLTAQTTEGPYYFDAKKVRTDITEGLPGTPLDMRFRVVDAAGAPFAGARVDIWHCNAAGVYSGYAGQGDDGSVDTRGATFLRGTQMADSAGEALFHTVYPGWYRGRTTHIHFKVIDGDNATLTSQFFLPDALSEFLYTQVPAYARDELRDTLNSSDGILLRSGDTVLGCIREQDDRYVATLDVAVNRTARPTVDPPPAPGSGRREGSPPGRPPQRAGREGRPRQPLQGEARIAALVPGDEAR